MTKDFASRSTNSARKSQSNKPKKRKPKSRASAPARVLFHGPSFACGALVGAAIVVLAAYGPEYMESQNIMSVPATVEAEPKREVTFTFSEELKRNGVKADPEDYPVPEVKGPVTLQAASFRKYQDAERLRATLILENLTAYTEARTVDGTQWYRVMVGPLGTAGAVERAFVLLNEMGLGATKSNNHN